MYILLGLLIMLIIGFGAWIVPLSIGLLITRKKWSDTDPYDKAVCWGYGVIISMVLAVVLLGGNEIGLYIQSHN